LKKQGQVKQDANKTDKHQKKIKELIRIRSRPQHEKAATYAKQRAKRNA
jgi:hypothetical protein